MKYEDFGFGSKYADAHLSQVELPAEPIQKISDWLKKPSNFLVFCGNPGVGKTYLCAAICKEFSNDGRYIYYTSEKQFFQRLRGIIQKDWDYEYEIRKICEYPFIILDDLGSSQMTDWQKEVLFSLVDLRSKNDYPTLITSNLWMEDIRKEFHPRFASRLNDARNTVIELNWIDKRQRQDL